jgi:hypothetical protein
MKKLSLLFFVCFMAVSYGQQVIGSFPTMDGGMEGQPATGSMASGSYANGYQTTAWTTSSSAQGTYQSSSPRTGARYVNALFTSTTKRLQSPTAGNGAIVSGTNNYTVQYYYRTSGSTAPGGGTQGVGASCDGTNPLPTMSYSTITPALVGTSNVWTKFSILVSGKSSTNPSPQYGYVAPFRTASAMTVGVDIDDFCMYLGAVDNTAPDPITVPNFASVAATQMTVSWTAPGTGTDGGGYLVVRGLADPTTAPNVNGIYAIGSTVASGQQVVYIGTNTSFVDNGLSNSTHYYYRIYTVDKAFNYSGGVALDGSTTAPSYASEPTVQASNITFANITPTSFDINWTNSGDGTNHLVVVKSGSAVDANPTDGGSYTPSTTFGVGGSQLGTGNYVVYNSTGNTVSISGLSKVTKYYVSIFEFNGSAGSENYLITSPPSNNQTTLPAEITSNGTAGAGVSWTTTSIWTGGVMPGPGDNVTIAANDKVIIGSSQSCYNLTIQPGGKVYNNIALPNSNLVYLTIFGTTATINGTLGDKTDAGTTDCGLGINFNGNLTFNGSGTIRPCRLRPYANAQNITLTIDADMELTYTGGSGTGGAGLFTDNNTNDNITITVNPGKTLSFVDFGNFNTASSSSTNGTANTTININGIVNMPGLNSNLSLPIAAGKTATLNVNGTLNIGHNFYASSAAGGAVPTVNVGGSGAITVGGNADFSGATFVSGAGSFTLSPDAIITIGAVAGLDPSNGPVRTSTRSFSTGALYSYVGTSAQVTGSDLPSSVKRLTINNAAGVSLTNSVNVTGTSPDALYLTNGKLTLGSNNLSFANLSGGSTSSYVVTDGTGGLTRTSVGALDVTLPVGTDTYTPVVLNNAGTADDFTAKVKNTFDYTPYTNEVVTKQWTITEAVAGGSNATVKLQWNTADENPLFVRTNPVYVSRYSGSAWEQTSASYTDLGGGVYNASAGGYTAFSPFGVGNNDALPVELSSFTSNVNGRDINLAWETKTEKNSNVFEVERLSNLTWSVIGSVQAAVLSNSPKQYSFTDKSLQAGKYQYRLKMIDNDGSFQYSRIVETEVSLPKDFELSQNYPNPFNPSTRISYNLPSDSKVTLEVYNTGGEKLAVLVDENQSAGFYSVNFMNKNISSGVYIYRLTAIDKASGNNFSSIKKMMLLK